MGTPEIVVIRAEGDLKMRGTELTPENSFITSMADRIPLHQRQHKLDPSWVRIRFGILHLLFSLQK
jgi:hypothetical protein